MNDEIVPGTLAMLILRSLLAGQKYGYGIAQRLKQSSGDVLKVGESSLYPALQKAGSFGNRCETRDEAPDGQQDTILRKREEHLDLAMDRECRPRPPIRATIPCRSARVHSHSVAGVSVRHRTQYKFVQRRKRNMVPSMERSPAASRC